MRYELFVGLRYLRARRSERFISLLTLISILGVMIAVVTLNLAVAVMTGFEEVFRDRLLSLNAHVVLVKPASYLTGYDELASRLEKREDVTTAAPALTGQIILTSERRVSGAIVRGIDPDRAPADLEQFLQQGRMSDLKTLTPVVVNGRDLRLPGIIIGDRLADQLRVRQGDALQAVSPIGSPTAVGLIPRIKRFAVVGIFDSGMREYDAGLVFLNLPDAQGFFGFGKVATSIEITVDDVGKAQGIAEEIQSAVGRRYLVEDWSRLWPNLFAALRLEKTVYFLVLLLMVLIAAFNIISTLIMVVMEKRKDIAVLRSMGASRGSIRMIFLLKGWIIGAIGTLSGVVLGYVLAVLLQRYQFIELPEDVFPVSTVPVSISPLYFGVVALASLAICCLASIYPARQAARLHPVDIIRYE
jgi:lipoprotein-releasing system permease protein